jgi:very-short-patch-repair endonuclease
MNHKITKSKIVEKCNIKFNNKYDYSLVEDCSTKQDIVKIICPVHGIIIQRFKVHMLKGCTFCKKGKTTNKHIKQHIDDLKIKHGDKYEYYYDESQIKWNNYSIIKVLCKKHNFLFERSIKSMKTYKINCDICIHEKLSINKFKGKGTKKFIKDAIKIHGDKYDYSLVDYKNGVEKVKIICKIHGIFEQSPKNHTNIGQGCPICKQDIRRISIEDFLNLAINKHGLIYSYDLVSNIKNCNDYVNIICQKHGIFNQSIKNHIYCGNGCPVCRESKGEEKIRIFLHKNNIDFEDQKTFEECRNINKLEFDFYVKNYNICIEFDGIQHFKPVYYFDGLIGFQKTIKNDSIKTKYCSDNNIKLIRIPYYEIKNIESILKTELNIND